MADGSYFPEFDAFKLNMLWDTGGLAPANTTTSPIIDKIIVHYKLINVNN